MAEQMEGARTVRPFEIREALEQAITGGRGIVVLEVRRPGQQAVHAGGSRGERSERRHWARLSQMVWAAVWDSLALEPQDGHEEEQR